ncbi:hypothetical protein ACGFIG_20525 [Micromonospora sp. NPDC049048]|uniref:hypothetical protein n=1 Tax=Micromonospora sp. NPDC049048 TaxID=3364263 RepID=UPI00371337C8
MARQGWGASIATAVGVAAGAGAAQLGFGYGLGIINWAPADATAGATAWVAGLIWATWITATSTVFGAVFAQRLRDRAPAPAPDPDSVDATAAGPAGGVLGSVVLAGAAGLGALITVLLVAVPAREAVTLADTDSPRNVAAVYAAVGVLIGVLTAVWALRSRAAANNVIATVGWLWLLAVIAVVDGVLAGRGLTSAQLGIWQLGPDDGRYWIRDYFYWPGALLSLGSALVIGALAASRDARDPDRRVGAAVSGAAGPLLVAIAYFLAVPRLTAISPEQVSAHLIAPYAVIIGVGGAVLVTVLAQRAARRAAARGPVRVPRQRTGEPVEPDSGQHSDDADAPTDATGSGTVADGSGAPATSDDSDTGSGRSGTAKAPARSRAGTRRASTAADRVTAATGKATSAEREPAPLPATGSPAAPSGGGLPTPAAEDGTPASTGAPADDPAEDDSQPTGRRTRSGRRTR